MAMIGTSFLRTLLADEQRAGQRPAVDAFLTLAIVLLASLVALTSDAGNVQVLTLTRAAPSTSLAREGARYPEAPDATPGGLTNPASGGPARQNASTTLGAARSMNDAADPGDGQRGTPAGVAGTAVTHTGIAEPGSAEASAAATRAERAAVLARESGQSQLEVRAAEMRAWVQGRIPTDDAARSITPDQLEDGATLTVDEAFAACAPAAAVAFAHATGRNLSLDDAVAEARKVGWSAAQGIPGPHAEIELLRSLGIVARLSDEGDAVDWPAVVRDIEAGRPAIVVTTRHYFVAERYDSATGRLDFGRSALVLRGAGGERWFAPDRIGELGYGPPIATIHLVDGPAVVPSPGDTRLTTGAY
ncbi:MAG: hypothetical protein IT305_11630 [Chloroflexi bacterium]|nr:hypothetical protein [Chloroflexota bacterium]